MIYEPLVSIIVPTYNRASLLQECIDSILVQTVDCFELIVVDDGSTDTTSVVLKQYSGDLQTITHLSNLGVSAARNTGIKHARGTYIAFCDSDDLWKKNKLELQLQLFQDSPDVIVCHTDEIWIRRGKRVNPKKYHYKSGGQIFSRCLELCAVSPSSVMMHRRFFDTIGNFDESLPACEDYDLWLRASLVYPFHFLDRKLLIKRGGHEDQLSQKYWGMDRFRIQAIEKCLRENTLTKEQRQEACSVLQKKCTILANGAVKRGKWEEAEKYRAIIARWLH